MRKKKDSLAEWAAKKGIKIAYDNAGAPIVGNYVRDAYLSEVYGYTLDPSTNQWVTDSGSPVSSQELSGALSWSGGMASGAVASLGTLAVALVDGELDSKEAIQVGVQGGKAWANKGIGDWIDKSFFAREGGSINWTGVGGNAGLGAGLGALSALATGGDVTEGAIRGGVGQGVQSAISQYATSTGLSKVAGATLGAAGGGIVSIAYDAFTGNLNESSVTSAMGSTIGTALGAALTPVFGPAGIIVGGALGGMVGGMVGSDKPKPSFLFKYGNGNNVVWDEKSGKFVAQRPEDVIFRIGRDVKNLSPSEKRKMLENTSKENAKIASELNSKFSKVDYDKLSANDAYEFDKMREKYSYSSVPTTEEEYRKEYNKYMKGIGKFTEITYEDWRAMYSRPEAWQWKERSLSQKDKVESILNSQYSSRLPSQVRDSKKPWETYQDKFVEYNSLTMDGSFTNDAFDSKLSFYNRYKDKDRSTLNPDIATKMDSLDKDILFKSKLNEDSLDSNQSNTSTDFGGNKSDQRTSNSRDSSQQREAETSNSFSVRRIGLSEFSYNKVNDALKKMAPKDNIDLSM